MMARIMDDFRRLLGYFNEQFMECLRYTIAHLYSFIHVVAFGSNNSSNNG